MNSAYLQGLDFLAVFLYKIGKEGKKVEEEKKEVELFKLGMKLMLAEAKFCYRLCLKVLEKFPELKDKDIEEVLKEVREIREQSEKYL